MVSDNEPKEVKHKRIMEKIWLNNRINMFKAKGIIQTKHTETEDTSFRTIKSAKLQDGRFKYSSEKMSTEETNAGLGFGEGSRLGSGKIGFRSILSSSSSKKPIYQSEASQMQKTEEDDKSLNKVRISSSKRTEKKQEKFPLGYKPILVTTDEYWHKPNQKLDQKKEKEIFDTYLEEFMLPRGLKRMQTSGALKKNSKSLSEHPDADKFFEEIISNKIENDDKTKLFDYNE